MSAGLEACSSYKKGLNFGCSQQSPDPVSNRRSPDDTKMSCLGLNLTVCVRTDMLMDSCTLLAVDWATIGLLGTMDRSS